MGESSSSSRSGDGRVRNWTFVLYPESAPSDWRERLDSLHIQWVESPLHQFDTNANGEVKKAHYHVLLIFPGKKSYEQIFQITDSLHCPRPERCLDAQGLVRYMAHMDNPEKYQYSASEIVGHGGVDVSEYLKPTSGQRYQLIAEMADFISENGVTEFKQLFDYARVHKFDSWFPLLCDNSTYVLNVYIRSIRESSRISGSGTEVGGK